MKALTLRGFDEDLSEALKAEATRSGTSLNATVINVLRRAFGLTDQKFHVKYRDLDHLAGTWSEADRQAFERNTRFFSEIDKDLWT